jgi:glutathione peroxidase
MIRPVPSAFQQSRRLFLLFASALGSTAVGLPLAGYAQAPPLASSAAACPALLQHSFLRLQDEKPQSLCQYAGRVVLVVNTASYCGFTGQYAALETLYRRYQGRGLVVLGFPSNDFGRQEPGNNQAIADFCENTFGVKFPMFSKTVVLGPGAHPLYRQLAQRSSERPGWNFHKYLIARDGQTVSSFASAMAPDHPTIVREIEKLLSVK